MKQPKNLSDLLALKLAALYDTEKQLVKALPKLADAATDPDLKGAFRTHLDETLVHVERIESVFRLLGHEPKAEKSEAIRGIVEDGSWVAKKVKDDIVRDSLLAAAASYAEHYEMAGYMAAIRWAKRLGHKAVVTTLTKTLEEEQLADEMLTKFAEGKLDDRAENPEVVA
jgi:ferritin-like metal-binding protein YciE